MLIIPIWSSGLLPPIISATFTYGQLPTAVVMLPLKHDTRKGGNKDGFLYSDDLKKNNHPWRYLVGLVKKYSRIILKDEDSRNLFFFLCINLSFAFVELAYGAWTNSLGLISDGFHMLFDCTALLAGLLATVVSKWPSNERFSFGYGRAEILGGFVNAVLLVFVAFFVLTESLERLVEPPEVSTDRLFLVSVLGFVVNLVGIFVFQHGGSHGHSHGGGSDHGHSHGGHGHSHAHGHSHGGDGEGNQIMKGVFLHILADTLGSVGVIISSLLIEYFGWMKADPICSLFIAVLIGLSVLPLLKDSTFILLQRCPIGSEGRINAALQKVHMLDGVLKIREPHFWSLCTGKNYGSAYVTVRHGVDYMSMQRQILSVFEHAGIQHMVVQIDYGV